MASICHLLLLMLFVGQTSGFLFRWFTKDYVCASTCTRRFCPFGFVEKGCPRCQCSQNPCKSGTCQPGFRCETKATECAAVFRCPHEAVCVADRRTVCAATCPDLECPYGFLERGCPRCECVENPCKANTCNVVFEDCVNLPVECASNHACPHRANCVIRPGTQLDNPRECSETCPDKACPYGFLDSGCPRCTCALNPCEKMQCGNGLVCHSRASVCKYENRCPYEAECRDTACAEYCPEKNCPYGFMMDSCPRCTCAPNPCQAKICQQGHHCFTEPAKCRFLHNCYHIASCNENVCSDVCPEKTCPFGFLAKGCPRCECVLNPCLTVRCPLGEGCTTESGICEFGTNCPKVPVCKSVCEETSERICRHGYLSRGCPRSICAPDPCRRFSCPANHVCESRESKCEFSTGCPHQAACKPPPACEASCRIKCEFGMLPDGCPRCHCAPDPCLNSRCLWGSCVPAPSNCSFTTNCPHKATCVAPCEETCDINCPFGFLNSGCPRCICAPDPCLDKCEEGASCTTRAVGCPFKAGCPHEGKCHKSRKNHRCLQKRQSGNCRKYLIRYYFNYNTRRCERFQYGGCGGSINNFSNYWTCLLTCALVF